MRGSRARFLPCSDDLATYGAESQRAREVPLRFRSRFATQGQDGVAGSLNTNSTALRSKVKARAPAFDTVRGTESQTRSRRSCAPLTVRPLSVKSPRLAHTRRRRESFDALADRSKHLPHVTTCRGPVGALRPTIRAFELGANRRFCPNLVRHAYRKIPLRRSAWVAT